MGKVIWSRRAATDVVQACEYLERDSPAYASWFGQRVLETTDLAASQPYIGALVPEYGEENFRERRVGSYRIMYEVHRDAILIITIIHGARNLPATRAELSS